MNNIPGVQPTNDTHNKVTVDPLKSNLTSTLEPPKVKDYQEVVAVETAGEKANSKKLKYTTSIVYTQNFGILRILFSLQITPTTYTSSARKGNHG